jgi:hypothetical protein
MGTKPEWRRADHFGRSFQIAVNEALNKGNDDLPLLL